MVRMLRYGGSDGSLLASKVWEANGHPQRWNSLVGIGACMVDES